jgi:hypothetical protein
MFLELINSNYAVIGPFYQPRITDERMEAVVE